MNRPIKILAILTILVVLSIGLPAQEKRATSAIFAVSKDAKIKLKAGQTVAIFLNGNDTLFTRIVEDAVDIHLTNAGFNVVNREKLEKTVGEHIDKKRKEKPESAAINALEIGKSLSAHFIVTGTVVIESEEQKSLIVRIGSFQLVDVAGEKTLINVLFEPEKGKSLSETAKDFVEIVRQSM